MVFTNAYDYSVNVYTNEVKVMGGNPISYCKHNSCLKHYFSLY